MPVYVNDREPESESFGFKKGDAVRVYLSEGKVTYLEKLVPPMYHETNLVEVARTPSLGKMYRYIDTVYSTGDDDYGYSSQVSVSLYKFDIIKETLKGQWIQDELRTTKPRFVLNHGRKRFAHHSKEEALQSFIARKKKQIGILTVQLLHVRKALHYVGGKEDTE